MSILIETINAAAAHPAVLEHVAQQSTDLATGGWDLKTFLENAGKYAKLVGGAFLTLIGIAGVIWSGFLIIKKFFGGQSGQQDSWVKILGLLIFGGALMAGGWSIMDLLGKGGQKTITDLGGGGFVVLDAVSVHFQSGLGVRELFTAGR